MEKPFRDSSPQPEAFSPMESSQIALPKPGSRRRWWIFLGGGLLALAVIFFLGPVISHPLEAIIGSVENAYQKWFIQQTIHHPLVLLTLAFLGGLLASVSPCILALLPVNLSYIGTLNITSRWDAFCRAGFFVLGAVTVLSGFGLASSFAGAVLVSHRGYFQLGVGSLMILMGLWLLGWIPFTLPQTTVSLPKLGSYGVGITFALVSSPCASPVLFTVLAAAAATGSQEIATLTMICYAFGYTMLIFLSSLWAGLIKQSRRLLHHSETVIQVGSLALVLTGVYYVVNAIQWFWT